MVEGAGIRLIGEGQATVGVKEAAALAGCSVKRMRSAIRRGEVRGEKRPGKYGAEWRVESSSIPEGGFTLAGAGHTQGDKPGGEQALEELHKVLRRTENSRDEYLLQVGRLQKTEGQLTARAESLQEQERAARSEAEALGIEVAQEQARAESLEGERRDLEGNVLALRASLKLRTWAAVLLLVGFVVAVGAAIR